MQHISADYEVKRASLEALLCTRSLEIKYFVFHSGKSGQLLHGAAEKCRGDITEDVGMQIALDERQDVRRQSARSSPNLQDSQSAALRQMAGGFLHGRGDCRQPVAGVETLAVELVQQLRRGPSEQHLHRILLATQDGTEFGAVRGAKQPLGQMS